MAGIVPIMIASIVFNTVYAQMSTVFVEQVNGRGCTRFPPGCAPPVMPKSSSLPAPACCPSACGCSMKQPWSTQVSMALGGVLHALHLLCMQGLTMDLSVGPHASIASASLSSFDSFAIIIMVGALTSLYSYTFARTLHL